MKKLLSILFIAVLFNACNTQEEGLSLNLKKGEAYNQNTKSEMSIIQEINGQKMEINMTLDGNMIFEVTDINDGKYLMDASFSEMKMTMNTPQGSMEFSSENPAENDLMSKVFSSMTEKKFQLTLLSSGKVEEIKNIDSLWNHVINSQANLNEMQKRQIQAQIMQAYGDEAMTGSIESALAIYPDNPVKEDDEWSIQTNMESGFSATINTDYHYVEDHKDYALIRGNGTIKTANKEAYVQSNGMPMKYDLTGTMNSEVKIDKETGWIIESVITQDISGKAHIKANEQMPMDMEIPMEINSKTTITNSSSN